MTRFLLLALLIALPAQAQVTFETEDTPAPPPPPTWSTPQLDFRLVARLSVDTAFEGGGENVASLYRFATASFRTERGPLRIRLGARLRWFTTAESLGGDRRWSSFDPQIGESSVSWSHSGIDVSAGFLDIAWGQNPAFSPADVLTPVDLRDGPFVGPDNRLPVLAARVRGALGPLRWDAVWLPIFMASKLPLFGNDWNPYLASPSGGQVLAAMRALDPTTYANLEANPAATKLPQQDLTAPQGGLRLSTRQGPFDLALSWAEFFDRNPEVHVSPQFAQLLGALQGQDPLTIYGAATAFQQSLGTTPPLTMTYLRTRVFAFDAAVSLGKLRMTLDAGYSPARVFPLASLTSTVHPMASGVLGFEWEGPPVIAAGVYSMAALNVAPGEQLLYLETGASDRQRTVLLNVVYLAASDQFLDDRLEVTFNGLATQNGDFFLTPSARWHIGDAHTVGLGANLIGGPHGGMGATYHRNNEAFAEYVLKL